MRVLRDYPCVMLDVEDKLGELAARLATVGLHRTIFLAKLGGRAIHGHADDLTARDRADGTSGLADALAGVALPREGVHGSSGIEGSAGGNAPVDVLLVCGLGNAIVRHGGRHCEGIVRHDVAELLVGRVVVGADVVGGTGTSGFAQLVLELQHAVGSVDGVDDHVERCGAGGRMHDVVVGVEVHLGVVLGGNREVEVPAIEALEATLDEGIVCLLGSRHGAGNADEVGEQVVLVSLVEKDHAVVLGDEEVRPCDVDGVEQRTDVEAVPLDRLDGSELGREGKALVGTRRRDPLTVAVEHRALVGVRLHEAAGDVAVCDGEEVVLVDVGTKDLLVPDGLGLVDGLGSGHVSLSAGVGRGLALVSEVADVTLVLLLVEHAPCDRLVLARGEHAAGEANGLERAIRGSAPAVTTVGIEAGVGCDVGESVQTTVVIVEDAVRHKDVVICIRLLVVGDVDALASEDADRIAGRQKSVVLDSCLVPNHRRDRLSHDVSFSSSLFTLSPDQRHDTTLDGKQVLE